MRTSLDGSWWSSVCGLPKGSPSYLAVVIRWVIRVDRGWPGVDRLVGHFSLGRAVCCSCTTTALSTTKMSVRGWGLWAGARACTNALFALESPVKRSYESWSAEVEEWNGETRCLP